MPWNCGVTAWRKPCAWSARRAGERGGQGGAEQVLSWCRRELWNISFSGVSDVELSHRDFANGFAALKPSVGQRKSLPHPAWRTAWNKSVGDARQAKAWRVPAPARGDGMGSVGSLQHISKGFSMTLAAGTVGRARGEAWRQADRVRVASRPPPAEGMAMSREPAAADAGTGAPPPSPKGQDPSLPPSPPQDSRFAAAEPPHRPLGAEAAARRAGCPTALVTRAVALPPAPRSPHERESSSGRAGCSGTPGHRKSGTDRGSFVRALCLIVASVLHAWCGEFVPTT